MIEEKFAETKWGKLAYLESGHSHKTIIFLHGLLGWPVFVERFSKVSNAHGWQFIAPYLPGAGPSFPIPKNFTFTDVVSCLDEFLRGLGKKSIIVGHSYGGSIGRKLLEEKTGYIKGMVLADPWVTNEANLSLVNLTKKFFYWMIDKGSDLLNKDYKSQVFKERYQVNTKITLAELFGIIRIFRTISFDDHRLTKDIPVEVLWGKNDTLVPEKSALTEINRLNLVALKEFPGGHYWFARNPELLIDEVMKFADSVKL